MSQSSSVPQMWHWKKYTFLGVHILIQQTKYGTRGIAELASHWYLLLYIELWRWAGHTYCRRERQVHIKSPEFMTGMSYSMMSISNSWAEKASSTEEARIPRSGCIAASSQKQTTTKWRTSFLSSIRLSGSKMLPKWYWFYSMQITDQIITEMLTCSGSASSHKIENLWRAFSCDQMSFEQRDQRCIFAMTQLYEAHGCCFWQCAQNPLDCPHR